VAEGSGGKIRPAGGDRQRTEHTALAKLQSEAVRKISGRSCFWALAFFVRFPILNFGGPKRLQTPTPDAATAGPALNQIAHIGEFVMHRFDFTPYRRNTVGFDRLFELLENSGRTAQNENYPPFNIERTGENEYLVTVAVAGFKPEEIDITAQQNVLVVAGSKESESNDNRDFLHMGIANRNFERRFQLADHIHVTNADLADGLLLISLIREVPEALKPRKIEIGGQTAPTVIEHDADTKKKDGKAA
jgi:molecular chaperone IbpA